jgi:hypothetical protein
VTGRADRFRYEYGAQPLHLLATGGSLLLAGYGVLRLTEIPGGAKVLIWIVAAALLHDLVALPAYSVMLRLARGAAHTAIESRGGAILALNAIRIPAGLSLLLLLVYLPLILRIDPEAYESVTGLSLDPYLGRWLLISAGLFLVSGIVYAIRLRRPVNDPPAPRPAPADEGPPPPVSPLWRVATGVVMAGIALAVLWVVAALVVGLLSTGLSP